MLLFPPALASFIATIQAKPDNNGYFPLHFPKNADLAAFQDPYYKENTPLSASQYAFALNAMDDPFIIDLNQAAKGFPVYFTWHDQMQPEAITGSLAELAQHIQHIRQHAARSPEAAAQYIADYCNTAASFWREVQQSFAEHEHLAAEIARCATPPDDPDYVFGDIIVSHPGRQSTRLAASLKKHRSLNTAQALALSKSPPFVYCSGIWKHMKNHLAELQAIGVQAEFVPKP